MFWRPKISNPWHWNHTISPPPRFSYRNRNLRTHPIHGHENRPVSSVPRDDQSRWWWMNYEPLGIQVILLMGPWNPAETPVEVGSLSHCSQGFIHPRCCRISSINSRNPVILSKIEQGVSFITSETHRSFRFHDTILRRWTIFNEFVPKTAYHVACFLVKLWKTRVNLNCGLFKQLKTIDLKFCLMLAKNQLASSSLSQHTHTHARWFNPKANVHHIRNWKWWNFTTQSYWKWWNFTTQSYRKWWNFTTQSCCLVISCWFQLSTIHFRTGWWLQCHEWKRTKLSC